jgi:tetratricopeptide (TPR) repeat protein
MAREHPVVGTGAGSFNVLFERFRPEGFLPNPVWAHNDYLNTLSDYGAIGFVLFFGAAVAVALIAARRGRDARQSSRRDWLGHPLVRQGLGVGLLAFAIQLFVDFHFKIPALAMAFASVAALLLSRGWPAPMTEPVAGLRRGWTVGAALLVAIVIAIGITPRYRAEALRFAARESMDRMAKSLPTESIVRSRLVDVRAQLERAVEIAPDNARAWSDLSYALVQMGRISPVDKADLLGREAEKAADRAIALCPRVAEFWVRRGGARDLQNRWAEASPDFAQAVVLSPNAVLPWYYYAYHMLLRPIGLDMGQAAVEYCLRLDPTDPDVQALRQRLATTSRSSL